MARQLSSSWARLVGHTLAHGQNLFDKALRWGFKELKVAGKQLEEPPPPAENQYVTTAKKIGRGTIRFLGEAGDAYFKRYEDLKSKKA